MPNSRRPIGIFDSGVGGLTVMREIVRALPNEQLIYFGDTARLPYGNKSRETIIRFSLENARVLCDKGIKLLVVACNTATAFALSELQAELPIPVVGVIAPGVQAAIQQTKTQAIAVLGTRGTIASNAYQKAILQLQPSANLHAIACPLFVPLVEEGFLDHPSAVLIAKHYLQPLRLSTVDTIILGCTHYPMLRDVIKRQVGERVAIIDSASACAVEVQNQLKKYDLLASEKLADHVYFVSDNSEAFNRLGSSILGKPISSIDWP
jgi:glutamate racemase